MDFTCYLVHLCLGRSDVSLVLRTSSSGCVHVMVSVTRGSSLVVSGVSSFMRGLDRCENPLHLLLEFYLLLLRCLLQVNARSISQGRFTSRLLAGRGRVALSWEGEIQNAPRHLWRLPTYQMLSTGAVRRVGLPSTSSQALQVLFPTTAE